MKYFTYLAVSVMIIAVISLFYLKKPNGETWLSTSVVSNQSQQIKDKIISFTSNTFEQAVNSVSNTSSTTRSKIFKWQDQQGQWHFSDTPHPNGKSVEVKLDPKDINVVVAQDTAILSGSSKSSAISSTSATPTVYDPVSIKKVFDDAEKAKQKLEQRTKQLNDLNSF
ncbi:hypothetical protein PTRA_a0171 [Pseudoalteromonas translucida KMM 520]|uniref:DUF4124 domain-containing protein n=1 Tax=Pseudoalteromonas translucida KMM 520 TaxID=1315283 RepID=A0A0U2NDN4_9GAMM|nr:DUF4124 domain-containing protein [Pseudoalteromonas translucida]ALS31555.1 hypothetical protein PTRA_a0171 [Pseudoalteromonas translucida KMM 520]